LEVIIRPEKEKDYFTVENLTREAFWNFPERPPGCDEHYLVHILRKDAVFIKELDYVALVDGEIVGHIIYTKSKVINEQNIEYDTISFGPVSVLPSHQRKGIGSKLIRYTFKKAKKLGHLAVIIYGHPEYYPRFGFRDAQEYGITTPDGSNFPAFMVYELYKDALNGITGKFYESPLFHMNQDEVREFDKLFQKPM